MAFDLAICCHPRKPRQLKIHRVITASNTAFKFMSKVCISFYKINKPCISSLGVIFTCLVSLFWTWKRSVVAYRYFYKKYSVLVLKLRNFCHDRTQCAWLENWINTVVWDDNSRLKETGGASDGMTTLNFALSFSTFFWYLSSSSRVSMTTWFLWFCHAKFDNICGDFLFLSAAAGVVCVLTTISPKRKIMLPM